MKATPSGRQLWAHTASGRRTSGSACTSWQSPNAGDAKGRTYQYDNHDKSKPRLSNEGMLTGWPTMTVEDAWGGNPENPSGYKELRNAVKLAAPWPTPQTHDDRERGNTEADHHHSPHDLPNMAGWVSPQKGDGDRGHQAKRYLEKKHAVRLGDQTLLAGWATPRSAEAGHSAGNPARAEDRRSRIEDQVFLAASGPTPNGSPASTGKPGQLNPAHSRWLMGLPAAWDDCAATATPSVRPRRRRSSKPT